VPHIGIAGSSYPDGPHDSESILVHPLTGDLTVVTKSESGDAGLFRLTQERARDNQTVELALVRWLFFDANSNGGRSTTAADWSWDGSEVVIRSYTKLWHWLADPCDPDAHWDQEPSWWDTPSGPGDEAITYLASGDLVVSYEGEPMTIARIACTDWVESPEPCPEPCPGTPDDSGTETQGITDSAEDGERCGCRTAEGTAWIFWIPLGVWCRF
jgi:hypothetical protein